jgi:ubiquinone/menaquinone biosynthesis C-methylase UbiE
MDIIKKPIAQFSKYYTKCSCWGKLLLFIIMLLLLVVGLKGLKSGLTEGFVQNDALVTKTGVAVYDDFYAEIYDYLVFNNMKDEYEIGEIVNKTNPSSKSKVLDVGCGTGHHVAELNAKGFDVIGLDISEAMVKKAKDNFPNAKFQQGDALNGSTFAENSFTHIMCMYFTIYYFQDKETFLKNAFNWLMPGGFLVIHLVDRKKFDPILPPGNPLLLVSPQKYAKERITSTRVKFTDFTYAANFELNESKNEARFLEKFKNDSDGKVRRNEHTMYMPDLEEIVTDVQNAGFIVESKIDLIHCQYEYQYVYIFTKPN